MTEVMVPARRIAQKMDYESWTRGESVPWIDQVFEWLDALDDTYKQYKVELKPVAKGDWTIERHEIPRRCFERLYHVLDGPEPSLDRDTGWGDTTVLKKGSTVWMSDTRAEIMEHVPLLNKLWWLESRRPRVLINGLGIGMAVKAALKHNASHVDVVEIDGDIIEMVAPNFEGLPVTIHHADAFDMEWPDDVEWTLVWHDIWQSISEDNLSDMARLHMKYRHSTRWQESWMQNRCKEMRRMSRQFVEALKRQDWDEVRRLDPDF